MSLTMSCAIKANYCIWQNWISHTTNIRSVHSRLVYNRSGEWRDETMPILASTTVGFSYVTFLLVKLANVSRLVHWSVKTYNLMNPTLFVDLSTFPHIFGPAAESLLGSQGTVWKNNPAIDLLFWCFQSKVRFIRCLFSTDGGAGYTAHHYLWCHFCPWLMGSRVGHSACITAGLSTVNNTVLKVDYILYFSDPIG